MDVVICGGGVIGACTGLFPGAPRDRRDRVERSEVPLRFMPIGWPSPSSSKCHFGRSNDEFMIGPSVTATKFRPAFNSGERSLRQDRCLHAPQAGCHFCQTKPATKVPLSEGSKAWLKTGRQKSAGREKMGFRKRKMLARRGHRP